METHRIAQALGRLGGLARRKALSPAERRRIASQGGLARSMSRHAVRRIEGNLKAADAVDALRRAYQRRG